MRSHRISEESLSNYPIDPIDLNIPTPNLHKVKVDDLDLVNEKAVLDKHFISRYNKKLIHSQWVYMMRLTGL